MARYIDADLLIKNIANITDLRTLSTKTIGEAINNTPTADVVEVKHGEWIEVDDGVLIGDGKHIECSECGTWAKDKQKSNYCSHCGAKMDGERREGCQAQ